MLASLLILSATAMTALAAFPTKTLYQSPSGFFLENIAVSLAGRLILTSVASPTVHTLDPRAPNVTLAEVYTFPNSNGLTGIVEYQPDVYAVVASTLNLTSRRVVPGTPVTIWCLDLTTKVPAAKPIAVVWHTKVLNGLSTVPGAPHLVLAADSDIGGVYAIDMQTGAAHLALQDAAMAPAAPEPAHGINGLRARGGWLYFTNTERRTFSRVPLSVRAGRVHQAGEPQVLGMAQATSLYDDFAMDREGRAWVATPPGALTLVFLQADGTWGQENAAGDEEGGDSVFTQPTSAAFGREGTAESKILYVTTGGGQVVTVDTSSGEM